jgi:hypothetical protein
MTAEQSTYLLTEGATLVLRVDEGPWQTVVFEVAKLQGATTDAGEIETTGEDLAEMIGALDGITGSVDGEGKLVLSTEDTGETAVLEVDPVASTAAAALGLGPGGTVTASGYGPGSASLTSVHSEPYALPPAASMTVHVDGKARKITFGDEGHQQWTAEDVAAQINRRVRRKVARATGDGRVRITSPTQGVGSRVTVTEPAADAPDASAVLGFTGEAAHTEPYRTEPARLTCRPAAETAVVENLTSAPIELQLPTGRYVLPARGRLALARQMAADSLLLRLVAQGTVRMSPERIS